MAKPVHPAFVHFPIALLFLAYSLDILNHLATQSLLPASVQVYLPTATDATRASYHLLLLGLIAAVPTVITGGAEAIKLLAKQGFFEADGKTIRPKVKATISHALSADLVIAASAYIWYARRTAANDTLAGKLGVNNVALTPEAAYAPAAWHVGAEAVLAAVLALSSSIGGSLTYNYGVGFSSASAGVKKTQ